MGEAAGISSPQAKEQRTRSSHSGYVHLACGPIASSHTSEEASLPPPINGSIKAEQRLAGSFEVKLVLKEWDVDPWDLSQPKLNSLCTEQSVKEQLVKSLHKNHDEGNAMEVAILDPLSFGTQLMRDPINPFMKE
uniref:Uncharacterized protein n=1 Tax=Timema cristinae TaxID=61476 RepID=A0A7R9D3L1_TIMCR|nr:unnamed protein product [Timema cristinae]